MSEPSGHFHRHRFSVEIISHVVWLYYRFVLRFREFEELPFERGIRVINETIRTWAERFGKRFAVELCQRERQSGRTWHLDEIFVKIRGEQVYLWRAVITSGCAATSYLPLSTTPRCMRDQSWRELAGVRALAA